MTKITCPCGNAVEVEAARDWAQQLAEHNREAHMASATVRKESATPLSPRFRGARFSKASDGRVVFGAVPLGIEHRADVERRPHAEREGIAARGVGTILSRAWAKLTARGGAQ